MWPFTRRKDNFTVTVSTADSTKEASEVRRERAKYVWMFGCRMEGDEALMQEFPELRTAYSR